MKTYMYRYRSSFNGFLMFNAIIIFLLIGIFSSIILPIIFGNKSQTTMHFLRYKTQLTLENLIKQKVKNITYTCPQQTEYNSYYIYNKERKIFQPVEEQKTFNLKVKTKINNLIIPALVLDKYDNHKDLYVFKVNSKLNQINNNSVIVTQNSPSNPAILGVIDNYNESQLTIKPANKQVLAKDQEVILNLCKVHLHINRYYNNINRDQNNIELNISDGFQKITNKAIAILYKNDYHPTYQTPAVIAEKVIMNKSELSIKRPDDISDIQGAWLLCKHTYPSKKIEYQYLHNNSEKPINPAVINEYWYDYNISSNVNPNNNFERQFSILSSENFILNLDNTEYDIAALLELIKLQKISEKITIKSSNDLKIYGNVNNTPNSQNLPKIILLVNGNLTLEQGNFPFDLTMVKGQCILNNATLSGYLMINNNLSINGDVNISIDKNNYFYNKENYPLFWKSRSKYRLGTIIYDEY